MASGCAPATLVTAGIGEVREGEAEVGPHVGADRVAGEHPRDLPSGEVLAFEGFEVLDRERAELFRELTAGHRVGHGATQSAIASVTRAGSKGPSCTITR